MACSFHLVIPDPSGTRVLVERDGERWTLPTVIGLQGFQNRFTVTDVPAGVREQLGLDISVLRSVLAEEDHTDGSGGDDFLFTENLGDRPPRAGEWYGEVALSTLAMSDERNRAVFRQWFDEQRDGGPPRLQPWQRDGWFGAASSWIRSTLAGITDVSQFMTWSSSCLLRADAGDHRYYFKATPDFFHDEAALTSKLAELFPDTIPRPVAVDVDRGWMLLEDFGDTFVGALPLEHWDAALDALIGIQRRSAPIVDSLLRSGFADRRPAHLWTQIEDLAAGRMGELPDGMAERVRAALPRFEKLRGELERSPIPGTLVHGDFHANNVVFTNGRHMIFDWTDACVAHPFVDLATFFYVVGPALTDAAVRRRLRDHYLEGWSDLMPIDEAVDLFERAEPLALMYHAIGFQQILEALDPSQRDEWASHLPWWLDKALEETSHD